MFERETVIIKDGMKLSYDYVPDVLVGREEEMTKLSLLLRPAVMDARSETAYITGPVGTGKTAVSKRFVSDVAEYGVLNGIPVDYIYINCRKMSSDTMVIYQCVSHFDPNYPEKGFSAQEMLKAFRTHLSRSGRRFFIILDEINFLVNKQSGTELLYQFCRMSEDPSSVHVSLSLIVISQDFIIDKLDSASRSSFKTTNVIRFKSYSRNELRAIVSARADEAMKLGTVREEAIDAIADTVAGVGDARMAIDLLDKAARLAEMRPMSEVTAEDVRSVSDMVYSVVNQPKLQDLGKNELLALLSVSRAMKTRIEITVAEAERTYAVVCEEYNVEARKHTQFASYIESLIKQNMLVNKGTDSTRSKLVGLPDIPARTLSKRIEAILENIL